MAVVDDGVLGLQSKAVYKDPNYISEMKANFNPKYKDRMENDAKSIIGKGKTVSYNITK